MVSKIVSFRLLLVSLIIGCSSNQLEKRPDTPVGTTSEDRAFYEVFGQRYYPMASDWFHAKRISFLVWS